MRSRGGLGLAAGMPIYCRVLVLSGWCRQRRRQGFVLALATCPHTGQLEADKKSSVRLGWVRWARPTGLVLVLVLELGPSCCGRDGAIDVTARRRPGVRKSRAVRRGRRSTQQDQDPTPFLLASGVGRCDCQALDDVKPDVEIGKQRLLASSMIDHDHDPPHGPSFLSRWTHTTHNTEQGESEGERERDRDRDKENCTALHARRGVVR